MNEPDEQIAAQPANNGDLVQAANYLASAVQADPNNEEAWLLLGDYLSDPEKRRHCYQNVLKINPANQQALSCLSELDGLSAPGFSANQPETTAVEASNSVISTPLNEAKNPDEAFSVNLPALEETPFETFYHPTAAPSRQEESDSPVLIPTPIFLEEIDSPVRTAIFADPEEELDSPAYSSSFNNPWLEDEPIPAENAAVTVVAEAEGTPSQTITSVENGHQDTYIRPANRNKSPLRFLLFIFPLMLISIVGLIIALAF